MPSKGASFTGLIRTTECVVTIVTENQNWKWFTIAEERAKREKETGEELNVLLREQSCLCLCMVKSLSLISFSGNGSHCQYQVVGSHFHYSISHFHDPIHTLLCRAPTKIIYYLKFSESLTKMCVWLQKPHGLTVNTCMELRTLGTFELVAIKKDYCSSPSFQHPKTKTTVPKLEDECDGKDST